MSIVNKLDLTKNEGLYLVFVETLMLAREIDDAKRELSEHDVRYTWLTRGVGYNIQDLLNSLAYDEVLARQKDEKRVAEFEANDEYFDVIRLELNLARDR